MRKHTDFVFDREGNAVVGAEVYVRVQADNTLATLYSDDGVTTQANPVVTDNDGEFSFYAANNTYKLQVYVDAVQQNEISQFQHFDLDDISAFIWTLLDDVDATAARTTLGITLNNILNLSDPNADRILFWDDSAGAYAYLTPSTGLTISTTNLSIDEATAANIRANTADKVITTDAMWSAAAFVALTPGTNVAVDLNSGINFTLAMGGNYTLDNPTNGKAGQQGVIEITQDGTGSRTLAFGTNWKFAGGTDPTLSTAASAKDLLYFEVLSDGSSVYANLIKAIA